MFFVLMAGGSGTRFWPLSRKNNPKQFLKLFGNKTMLQNTFERISDMVPLDNIIVVTGENMVEKTKEQLPELPKTNIIAEPFGKNTAPCIALAASIIKKRTSENEVMISLPADHLVSNKALFQQTIKAAAKYAQDSDTLVTLGISPLYPETGYGYIQRNEKFSEVDGLKIYNVKTFAEKPNLETAERFLQSGDFYWNSGMFVWTVKSILNEFEKQQSDIFDLLPDMEDKIDTAKMPDAIYKMYSSAKSISIDYAIMERAEKVAVVESHFQWNDVGSWEAVYKLSESDSNMNVSGQHPLSTLNSKNNYFFSESGKLVAAIDLNDMIVVETKDAILVCKRENAQRVKDIVDKMRISNLEKYI